MSRPDPFGDAIDGLLTAQKDAAINGPPLPDDVEEVTPQDIVEINEHWHELTPEEQESAGVMAQGVVDTVALNDFSKMLKSEGYDPSTYANLLAHFDGDADKANKALAYVGQDSSDLGDSIGQLSRVQQAKAGRVPAKVEMAYEAVVRQTSPPPQPEPADDGLVEVEQAHIDAFLEYADEHFDSLDPEEQQLAIELAQGQ
jgi:hypothetical protein